MAPSHQTIKRLNSQRGTVAILFALLLPVLLGCAAFAIDLARINLTKAELQNAADAAALAGAHSLTAPINSANGVPIAVTIEPVGYWNSSNGVHPDFLEDDLPATRATATISVTLFFAPFLGNASINVRDSAIAVLLKPAGGSGASIPKLVK